MMAASIKIIYSLSHRKELCGQWNTHTYTHTQARMHTHAHTHTEGPSLIICISVCRLKSKLKHAFQKKKKKNLETDKEGSCKACRDAVAAAELHGCYSVILNQMWREEQRTTPNVPHDVKIFSLRARKHWAVATWFELQNIPLALFELLQTGSIQWDFKFPKMDLFLFKTLCLGYLPDRCVK